VYWRNIIHLFLLKKVVEDIRSFQDLTGNSLNVVDARENSIQNVLACLNSNSYNIIQLFIQEVPFLIIEAVTIMQFGLGMT